MTPSTLYFLESWHQALMFSLEKDFSQQDNLEGETST
jgi:hypothetical protein